MTIPKNTKRAQAVLENAKDIKAYSLGNCFRGEPLTDKPVVWGGPVVNGRYTELVPLTQTQFLQYQLLSKSTKLTQDGNGHYCIQVHSNLWYEFTA